MTEFVRVRTATGEASVSAEYAKLHGLKPLNKRATRNGVALEPKYNPLTPKKPPAPAEDTPQKENE